MRSMGKFKIAIYDVDGNFEKHIIRTVYEFNIGRAVVFGTYYGINYLSGRIKVRGDSSHPNGMYVFLGDFAYKSYALRDICDKIHVNHVFTDGDLFSIDRDDAIKNSSPQDTRPVITA